MTVDEKKRALEAEGFIRGARDQRLNRFFRGDFMVVESHEESELPTDDGRDGPWCIVGDDLSELIEIAYDVWVR